MKPEGRAPHLRGAAVTAVLIALGGRSRQGALLAAAAGLLVFESAQQAETTRRVIANGADVSALTAWLPPHGMEFGGYAIDADLASVLRSHIRHGGHRHIVEFGAGLSTLTLALALEELGGEGTVVSFEASRQFTHHVSQLIATAGLSERVRVIHAPLSPVRIRGREISWHDPELVTREAPANVDLLFVDGPVSADSWSRWPAVEVLWPRLRASSVILLDDGRRRREQTCAMRWARDHHDLQLSWIDTVTGVWHGEVRDAPRAGGASGGLHAFLRTVNPRPTGWGKWPARRV